MLEIGKVAEALRNNAFAVSPASAAKCFHKHVFRRVLGVDFVDVVLGLKVSSLLFGHGRDSLLQVRLLFEILFDLFVTLAHVLQG